MKTRELFGISAILGLVMYFLSKSARASINYTFEPNPQPDYTFDENATPAQEEQIMRNISKLTRGERNNNPGNIEKGQPWQGLANNQNGDSRFAVFSSPEYGIRAMAKLLQNYATGGKNTVRLIINKWAPSSENNTNAYITQVCKQMGVTPDQVLDLSNFNTLYSLVSAIINHENGRNIYADTGTIETALQMVA